MPMTLEKSTVEKTQLLTPCVLQSKSDTQQMQWLSAIAATEERLSSRAYDVSSSCCGWRSTRSDDVMGHLRQMAEYWLYVATIYVICFCLTRQHITNLLTNIHVGGAYY